MSKANGHKLKLLKIIDLFEKHTDENHPITTKQIIAKLAEHNIEVERKTIYQDIALLRDQGYDIIKIGGRNARYYLGSRHFELPELKLLMDAVQSSRFITKIQSERLVEKLRALTNVYQADELHRQVITVDVPKSFNASMLVNIDRIHHAINKEQKISFKYFDTNVHKEKEYRRNGERYIQSPIALCWNDDKYYLICFNSKHQDVTTYRVDRMDSVVIIDEPRDASVHDINITEHVRSLFGMYSGEKITSILEFDNSLVNVVIDRFGKNIPFILHDDTFSIEVEVAASDVFLAWIIQLGNKVKIISPDTLVDDLLTLAQGITETYQ